MFFAAFPCVLRCLSLCSSLPFSAYKRHGALFSLHEVVEGRHTAVTQPSHSRLDAQGHQALGRQLAAAKATAEAEEVAQVAAHEMHGPEGRRRAVEEELRELQKRLGWGVETFARRLMGKDTAFAWCVSTVFAAKTPPFSTCGLQRTGWTPRA